MGYFLVFNNKNCLEFGLKATQRPNIPIPSRNYNEIDIPGRDGILIEDLETYSDIKIDVEFNFVQKNNFYDSVRRIIFWLSYINDNTLTFSDDLDYFYRVKRVEYTDIERQFKIKGSLTISFICEAFRYYKDNQVLTILSNNYSIYSPELSYVSKPTLNIFGNGDITLTINGTDILLDNISSNIILNSSMEEAYSSDFANLNGKVYGDFPILVNGLNEISWIGDIAKIELLPNWRCL